MRILIVLASHTVAHSWIWPVARGSHVSKLNLQQNLLVREITHRGRSDKCVQCTRKEMEATKQTNDCNQEGTHRRLVSFFIDPSDILDFHNIMAIWNLTATFSGERGPYEKCNINTSFIPNNRAFRFFLSQ